MKKIVLCFIIAFTTLITNAQNTYVPDDNFEQALIDLGFDTGVLDNYVLTANINTITSLNVAAKGISDLTGIEDFIGLTNLTIYNNQLTSLNISNNTSLTYLFVYGNQLTTIDVTANPGLTYLNVGNNQLTSIDITNNTLVSTLHIPSNQITSLDLGMHTALTYLDVSNNQLTSLNIKNNNNTIITTFKTTANPNLVCVEVDDATWSNANWINIGAITSFNEDCASIPLTYVPDDNFEQALIVLGFDNVLDDYISTENINSITSLNVAAKGISDLTGIEDFTGLTDLTIYNNQLTSLNISNNTSLTYLFAYGNQLTTIDVTANPGLTYLNVGNNQLTSLDITNNTLVSTLHIPFNQITSLD